MYNKTVYAAEVLSTIAERENLEQFTGTPIYIHGEAGEELVGWLGCPLPTNGYPCEHMGMGDEGSTACWSATEINRLREENDILRKLVSDMLNAWDDVQRETVTGPTFDECEALASEMGIEL